MNPTSLGFRNIFPIESFPGEILDYKIKFFGAGGMAEAFPEEGQSFHGVVHKMSKEQMELLDSIESVYKREPAKVKLYDDKIVDASVYTIPEEKRSVNGINNPPSERYIDIMCRGALHFGVK